MLEFKARYPSAVLEYPVVLELSAWYPVAVLLLPFELPFELLDPLALQRLLAPVLEPFPAPLGEPFVDRADVWLVDSEVGRRAVRLLEAGVGLRSREWAAGRLKCGRTEDGFCAVTGLCAG